MKVDRAAIERMVPHAGVMCLVDAVIAWDPSQIQCRSDEPGALHPLARNGVVPAIAAAEYAAQATAVHGALLDGANEPRAGVLAKLSDVQLHAASFPRGCGALTIHAQVLGRSEAGCLYSFDVASAIAPIASGRLMVAFAAPGATP
ncbi:MAG TPA: 3-hydroxylacyl-ACP dehydratase [Ramlibacter sp.]|nr:3-hydroxylacyl-ACP dehydratase [Ramlibacter sp.]